MNVNLLLFSEALSRLGRTRSMLYADVDRGIFPAPIKVGRTSCWRDDEVQSLLDGYTAGLDEGAVVRALRVHRPPPA